MMFLRLESDQLNNWSDSHAQTASHNPATKAGSPAPKAARAQRDLARLAHRALQALRKARLQVRPRPRSRAQGLSLCQQIWSASSDGVRAQGRPRPSEGVRSELPRGARDPRRDLRDQSRAPASARKAGLSDRGDGATRHPGRRHTHRKHGPGHPPVTASDSRNSAARGRAFQPLRRSSPWTQFGRDGEREERGSANGEVRRRASAWSRSSCCWTNTPPSPRDPEPRPSRSIGAGLARGTPVDHGFATLPGGAHRRTDNPERERASEGRGQ